MVNQRPVLCNNFTPEQIGEAIFTATNPDLLKVPNNYVKKNNEKVLEENKLLYSNSEAKNIHEYQYFLREAMKGASDEVVAAITEVFKNYKKSNIPV